MTAAGAGINRRDAVIALALAAASVLLFSFKWPFLSIDGATSAGAIRILDGQIPYRDFWTLYAPGSFGLVCQVALPVMRGAGCPCSGRGP